MDAPACRRVLGGVVSDRVQPIELGRCVAARLPAILGEVRDLLAERHPDYAQFVFDEMDEIVAAARGFVERLVEMAARDGSAVEYDSAFRLERALFEEIGRMHWRQDQNITGLLAAYRAGASVAWRHVADEALRAGVPAEMFAALASAVFAAVDQLSSATLHGYLEEQSHAAFARERLRDELTELLLSDRSDTAAIRAAAERARWELPRTAAVVLVDPDNEVGRRLLPRLGEACLRLRRPQRLVAVIPDLDGPGRRHRLREVVRGAHAVVGPCVPLDRLPASVRLAELALRLRRTGVLNDDPLFVDEHFDAILVHHDEQLLVELRARFLAPLAELPASTRDRLAETLVSWLTHLGNRRAVAAELHIHPQTVRYRLGRLRELFGSALDDPHTRSALLLAIAWGPPVPDDEENPG
jgi:PucR-like helix-turn-helix protein/diguanylate cyclase with GGDEF domain